MATEKEAGAAPHPNKAQPTAIRETVIQFARRRHVARRTVIDWIERGKLHATRHGYGKTSPWLIDQEQPRQDSNDPRPIRPPHRKKVLMPTGAATGSTQPFANTPPRSAAEWQQHNEWDRQRDQPAPRQEPTYTDDIPGMDPRDAARANMLRRAVETDW